MPSERSCRITSNSVLTSCSASADVGSSMITSFAWVDSARASAVICWVAIEYSYSGRVASTVMFRRSSSAAASAFMRRQSISR